MNMNFEDNDKTTIDGRRSLSLTNSPPITSKNPSNHRYKKTEKDNHGNEAAKVERDHELVRPHCTAIMMITDDSIHPMDVLCGRSKLSFNHPGNRRFRDLVSAAVTKYNDAESRLAKAAIVNSIVEDVRSSGGRYLRRDEDAGTWHVLTYAQCREKVGHAIRDATASIEARKKRQRIQEAARQSIVGAILAKTHNPDGCATDSATSRVGKSLASYYDPILAKQKDKGKGDDHHAATTTMTTIAKSCVKKKAGSLSIPLVEGKDQVPTLQKLLRVHHGPNCGDNHSLKGGPSDDFLRCDTQQPLRQPTLLFSDGTTKAAVVLPVSAQRKTTTATDDDAVATAAVAPVTTIMTVNVPVPLTSSISSSVAHQVSSTEVSSTDSGTRRNWDDDDDGQFLSFIDEVLGPLSPSTTSLYQYPT